MRSAAAIRSGYPALGENFRYLSYKSDVSPTSWISPLCKVYKCINDYVTDFIVTPNISHFIRELCICIDSGDISNLTSTEMSQLLEIVVQYNYVILNLFCIYIYVLLL